jgi:hypothetical protein
MVPGDRQEYSQSFLSVFLQLTGLVHITIGLIKTVRNYPESGCQAAFTIYRSLFSLSSQNKCPTRKKA